MKNSLVLTEKEIIELERWATSKLPYNISYTTIVLPRRLFSRVSSKKSTVNVHMSIFSIVTQFWEKMPVIIEELASSNMRDTKEVRSLIIYYTYIKKENARKLRKRLHSLQNGKTTNK